MRSFLQKRQITLITLSVFLFSNLVTNAALNPALKSPVKTSVTKKLIADKPVAKRSKVKQFRAPSATKAAPAAAYLYPGMVPYDGYGNYISFNGTVNNLATAGKEDYIFFPKDSTTLYVDASTNAPTSYLWTIPGGTPATAETQDLEVTYKQEGRFDFPTVKTTNTSGSSSYTATGAIKIGGKAEIASFNSFMLDSTYVPTYYEWQSNKGFVTGSNLWNDLGFGNLFILGQESAAVESVSVYIRPNPTAAVATNKVKLVLYEPGDDASGNFQLNNKVLATAELKVSDMMANAASVTGIAYSNGDPVMGMANFKFSAPVQVGSVFFASVENFGNNLAGKDSLCILMNDLDPIPADSFTTIASNSSWSYSETSTGTHSWFALSDIWGGTANPVLMICPVVDYNSMANGIVSNATERSVFISRSRNGFTVIGAKEGESMSVFTTSGQKVMNAIIRDSKQTFTGLSKGIYIVKVGKSNRKIVI